jgi:prolyl-tRNA editing enzyme YbaK/EbsC (Cys-tRNA(Pro) deacylase)
MKATAERVQIALDQHGLSCRVVELPASTRTAAEAAAAIGCTVSQIAKSIVFRGAQSGRAIVVIAPGSNRVDENAVAHAAGEPLARADADWVKQNVGYAIGGVPPLGHLGDPLVFFDSDLFQHATVWGAAGTPNAVFEVAPRDLQHVTRGRVL